MSMSMLMSMSISICIISWYSFPKQENYSNCRSFQFIIPSWCLGFTFDLKSSYFILQLSRKKEKRLESWLNFRMIRRIVVYLTFDLKFRSLFWLKIYKKKYLFTDLPNKHTFVFKIDFFTEKSFSFSKLMIITWITKK